MNSHTELGTITHHGHDYSALWAHVTDDRIVAYLGACRTGHAELAHRTTRGCSGSVTTWEGDPIGRYVITKSWRVYTRRGHHEMSQVVVILSDGRRYHGRSQGPGMVVTARRERSRRKDGAR